MKKLFFAVVICLLVAPSFNSQTDLEYSKALKKMFEVSGSEDAYKVAIKQIIEIYKKNYTNVSEETFNGLEKEFMKTSLNDLVDMLVPVYQKHLSQADLEELIKFYLTPA